MTEAEWFACEDPSAMLDLAHSNLADAQLRIFACACCRRIWHLYPHYSWERRLVEATEQYLQGRYSELEMQLAQSYALEDGECDYYRYQVEPDKLKRPYRHLPGTAGRAGFWDNGYDYLVLPTPLELAKGAADSAVHAIRDWVFDLVERSGEEVDPACVKYAVDRASREERQAQCSILREMVGNPFRPSFIGASWLVWNDGAIADLAQFIRERQLFSEMPLLAEALEEAGCRDARLLSHCQATEGHGPCCWVLEGILSASWLM